MSPGPPYDRDLIGYGGSPPDPRWPGGARLALQIVLNYEEGGERSILHGDGESEAFLQEVVGMAPLPGVRNLQVESRSSTTRRATSASGSADAWTSPATGSPTTRRPVTDLPMRAQ